MKRFTSKMTSNNMFININPLNKSCYNFNTRSLLTKEKKSNILSDTLLSNEPVKISFYSKVQVSKECFVLRFLLPESDKRVGFSTGQYLLLEASLPESEVNIKRHYHPVSLDTDKGFIDFMIKVYPKSKEDDVYGVFSNYLASLEEGQVIKMSGPFGKFKYCGQGEFHIRQSDNLLVKKNVSKIGMIAGGAGITPMFQLLQRVIASKEKTGLSLIYCTKLIEDLAFCEDLVRFDRGGKLSFFPVVETPFASKWNYGKGIVTQEMIENYMPSPKDKDSVIFLCGPKPMINNNIKPLLKSMNYPDENVLSFV